MQTAALQSELDFITRLDCIEIGKRACHSPPLQAASSDLHLSCALATYDEAPPPIFPPPIPFFPRSNGITYPHLSSNASWSSIFIVHLYPESPTSPNSFNPSFILAFTHFSHPIVYIFSSPIQRLKFHPSPPSFTSCLLQSSSTLLPLPTHRSLSSFFLSDDPRVDVHRIQRLSSLNVEVFKGVHLSPRPMITGGDRWTGSVTAMQYHRPGVSLDSPLLATFIWTTVLIWKGIIVNWHNVLYYW